jgi:uncharacterized protein (DUF169 family)
VDLKMRDQFVSSWQRYFGGAELPITFYYTDREDCAEPAKVAREHRCIINALAAVRKGQSLQFDVQAVGCAGARRYLGFSQELRPNFEHFLSCGLAGVLEGERYKKSPQVVREYVEQGPRIVAPANSIVFKRWDALEETDAPEVVIFFASPDVLSGLFTLANFDEAEPNGVHCPFSAGCGSIVQYPYLERQAARPRAILGMFDVSARPHVPRETLSFSVPMEKFSTMIENMAESFLITLSWKKVRQRIG